MIPMKPHLYVADQKYLNRNPEKTYFHHWREEGPEQS